MRLGKYLPLVLFLFVGLKGGWAAASPPEHWLLRAVNEIGDRDFEFYVEVSQPLGTLKTLRIEHRLKVGNRLVETNRFTMDELVRNGRTVLHKENEAVAIKDFKIWNPNVGGSFQLEYLQNAIDGTRPSVYFEIRRDENNNWVIMKDGQVVRKLTFVPNRLLGIKTIGIDHVLIGQNTSLRTGEHLLRAPELGRESSDPSVSLVQSKDGVHPTDPRHGIAKARSHARAQNRRENEVRVFRYVELAFHHVLSGHGVVHYFSLPTTASSADFRAGTVKGFVR